MRSPLIAQKSQQYQTVKTKILDPPPIKQYQCSSPTFSEWFLLLIKIIMIKKPTKIHSNDQNFYIFCLFRKSIKTITNDTTSMLSESARIAININSN